jgi:hypothetical protein
MTMPVPEEGGSGVLPDTIVGVRVPGPGVRAPSTVSIGVGEGLSPALIVGCSVGVAVAVAVGVNVAVADAVLPGVGVAVAGGTRGSIRRSVFAVGVGVSVPASTGSSPAVGDISNEYVQFSQAGCSVTTNSGQTNV